MNPYCLFLADEPLQVEDCCTDCGAADDCDCAADALLTAECIEGEDTWDDLAREIEDEDRAELEMIDARMTWSGGTRIL